MAEANEGAFALAVWLGVRAATTGKTHSHPSCLRIPGTIQDNNRSSSWLNSPPVPDPCCSTGIGPRRRSEQRGRGRDCAGAAAAESVGALEKRLRAGCLVPEICPDAAAPRMPRRPEHAGVQDGRYQPRIGVSIWLKDRLEEHLQP